MLGLKLNHVSKRGHRTSALRLPTVGVNAVLRQAINLFTTHSSVCTIKVIQSLKNANSKNWNLDDLKMNRRQNEGHFFRHWCGRTLCQTVLGGVFTAGFRPKTVMRGHQLDCDYSQETYIAQLRYITEQAVFAVGSYHDNQWASLREKCNIET